MKEGERVKEFLRFVDFTDSYLFPLCIMERISAHEAGYSVMNKSGQVLAEVEANNSKKAFMLEEFNP